MIRRKLLAVLVALAVVFTLAAPTAFAAENPEEEAAFVQEVDIEEEAAASQLSTPATIEEEAAASQPSAPATIEETPAKLGDAEKKSFKIVYTTYVNGEIFGSALTREFKNVDGVFSFNISSKVYFKDVTECEKVTLDGNSIPFTSDNVASVVLSTSQFDNGATAYLNFYYVYKDSEQLYSFKEKQVFKVGDEVIKEFLTQDIQLHPGETWTVNAYGWGPFKKDGLPEKYSKTYWWLGMTETRGGEDGVIGQYPVNIPPIDGSATMIHSATEHIFYYFPYYTATIKYQDENGLTLANQKTIAGYFESSVNIDSHMKTIEGYTFKEVKGDLVTSVENTEIILVYQPDKPLVAGTTPPIDANPDRPTPNTAVTAAVAELPAADARGYELTVIGEKKTPLAGGFLDTECCILHLLIMLLAAAVLIWYTKDMKEQQARIFELEDQLDLH